MRCFVTGATGFIGANLAHELIARGHQVKALARASSDRRALTGCELQWADCSITDRAALRQAMQGCDWCFHVAASYHLWLPDYAPMFTANVEGTEAVLRAAQEAGCSRIVYTSTVGCIGLPRGHSQGSGFSDESTPVSDAQMTNPYKRSKWLAECRAKALAEQGAPVVIVNPSAPVGPRDVKPTPTGRIVVDFLNRRLPAYVETGLNWVHVRDVAIGHIRAAESGRIGERYILGNSQGNWTMKQTLAVLSRISGTPAPRFRVPWSVAWAAACMNEAVAAITKTPPKAPLAGVRMAKYKMFFSAEKAVRELDLPQTPPERAFQEAVDWFRQHGYCRI